MVVRAQGSLVKEKSFEEVNFQKSTNMTHPSKASHIKPFKERPISLSGGRATYELNESEFGKLTDEKHKYVQKSTNGKGMPPPVEDLPSQYTFISTYLNYLVLIIIGHIRDFFAKKLNEPSSMYLKEQNGYAPLTSDFDSFYTRRLKRRLDDCFNRPTTGVPGRFVTYLERISNDYYYNYESTGNKVDCLNLSSYNYLGFAQSVGQCTDAAEEAINHYGVIAGGNRNSGGCNDSHMIAEKVLADFVGKDDSIIYSQGYGTNAVIFSTLVDKHCLVISDELNHASIRFGMRMSGAVIKTFKHNDLAHLEKVLREQITQGQPRTHRPWKKILIAVEGLYSMEGDVCDLPGLVNLRDKYKFYLFVDEAHSVGAVGPQGRGVCDYFGISTSRVDILMGTLTKSFGATGGYIAADKSIIERVKVSCIGSVYAEGPAPPVLAQIYSSLQTITGEVRPGEGEERVQRLAFNSRYLRLGLKRLGYIVAGFDNSPIVPMMLYNPAKMPAFSRMMLEKKIAVVVVGYPATPLTSSRVRFCVSASLTKEDLDRLLYAVEEVGTTTRLKISCEPSPIDGKPRRMKIEDVLKTLADDVQGDLSKF